MPNDDTCTCTYPCESFDGTFCESCEKDLMENDVAYSASGEYLDAISFM